MSANEILRRLDELKPIVYAEATFEELDAALTAAMNRLYDGVGDKEADEYMVERIREEYRNRGCILV